MTRELVANVNRRGISVGETISIAYGRAKNRIVDSDAINEMTNC